MVDINCIDGNAQYLNIETKVKLYGDNLIGKLEQGEDPKYWINLDAAAEFIALCTNIKD